MNEGYYVGHTRELRERLYEHRDGDVKSTNGKRPKLIYFEVSKTREEATKREEEIKKIVDKNMREVRRMVIGFRDLIRELEYDW